MTLRLRIAGCQMLLPHVAWWRHVQDALVLCNGATIAGAVAALYVAHVRVTWPVILRGLLVPQAEHECSAFVVSATLRCLCGLM